MDKIFKSLMMLLVAILVSFNCSNQNTAQYGSISETNLVVKQNKELGTIEVYRADGKLPIVTANARQDHRPYIHPIIAPDGKGPVTEYSPGHHKHQTGLFWGFTRVNGNFDIHSVVKDSLFKWFYRDKWKDEKVSELMGRDFYHKYEGDYWQLQSASVIDSVGERVSWKTVYNMLDKDGKTIMVETQKWSMRIVDGEYDLDLEWQGDAQIDITINEFAYGGMFLRMPWRKGMPAEVMNAARQKNKEADTQRSMWVNIGMQLEGRDDFANIAIFDHPSNDDSPVAWRVDGQFGVGPSRAISGDWKIDEGTRSTFKHRIVVHTGKLNDLKLTERWVDWSGNSYPYATQLWQMAQEEGKKEKFLGPTEATEAMTLIDGFEVNAWASEPMITQPMAFCWDDRGRMWIAENRDYESRGSGFSNFGDSRILILEDTDRDGVADNMKVFSEGIPFPSAIAVGFDGLFLGAPPNLLFIPDRDGDDKGDMDDLEILLTGWGIRDRHETINSLHWGPDGWLYGLEGFATPSKIRKPNGKGRLYGHKEPFPEDLLEADGVDIDGGVWRYHPTKRNFEVVAHGFSNPWGVDYNEKGQFFLSACVIPHLFHVVPGGIFHRQGGQHFNPYVYSDIRTIVDHRHRSAHGGARVYQSDAFPKEHNGRVFMANIHEHALLSDELVRKGSGFVAEHADDFLYANNAQFIGFSLEVGPEGGVYILDWHDGDICGKEVLHKETGRIYRVTPTNSLAEDWDGRYGDLKKLKDLALAKLQVSKSDWHARRARVILQGRAAKQAIDTQAIKELKKIFNKNSNPDYRLKGMWALHVTGSFSEKELIKSLGDKDEYVRAWAIQLLAEDKNLSDVALKKFLSMANKDKSAVVRLYLAAAMQRIDNNDRWDLAEALIGNGQDGDDHNIPKMIWFAVEPLVAENPERSIALAEQSNISMIPEFISRRLVDAGELNVLVAGLESSSKVRLDMLKGMRDGLEGQSDLSAPDNWSNVYSKLKANDKTSKAALDVAQQFGSIEATMELLATLKDENKPIKERKNALNGLARKQWDGLPDEIPKLLEDPKLRKEAIRAVAAYNSGKLGKLLLENYAKYNTAEKLEIVQAMSSRSLYGYYLTEALKREVIPKREVPAYTARQLRRVVGSGFLEVWGPLSKESSENLAAMEKYKTLLNLHNVSKADPNKGRYFFDGLCAACHKMYDSGGILGPELTGANRTDIDYLLNNVMDPSGIIQDDYKMVMITTRDGRTYAGNIANQNKRSIVLRVVGQDAVVISKSDIQSIDNSELSMMPEGMLDDMSTSEVLDLFSYLMLTTSQVEPLEE